jgi:hypothetical protein
MTRTLLLGLTATALALAAVVLAPREALFGWLAAFAFWAGVPLGALLLLMMTRAVPGAWSQVLAPVVVPTALLLPLAALAGVPVALDLSAVYSWTLGDLETPFRTAYFSAPFFLVRSVLFLAACTLVALALSAPGRRPLAIGALIAFVPLHTVIAFDWLMSLDPAFHSSGFGLYLLSMQALTAFCILLLARLALFEGTPDPLGALLLVALLLWIYFAFMQFFISWSTNLPAGAAWYGRRTAGAWAPVFPIIALLHAIPTLLLLFRPFRASRKSLAAFAVMILAGKAVETAWLVLPDGPAGLLPPLTALAALAGLGALGLAAAPLAARLGSSPRQRRTARP